MISKQIIDRFLGGSFSQNFNEDFIKTLETLREKSGSARIDQTFIFDNEANPGEPIIEINLTIKILGED